MARASLPEERRREVEGLATARRAQGHPPDRRAAAAPVVVTASLG